MAVLGINFIRGNGFKLVHRFPPKVIKEEWSISTAEKKINISRDDYIRYAEIMQQYEQIQDKPDNLVGGGQRYYYNITIDELFAESKKQNNFDFSTNKVQNLNGVEIIATDTKRKNKLLFIAAAVLIVFLIVKK